MLYVCWLFRFEFDAIFGEYLFNISVIIIYIIGIKYSVVLFSLRIYDVIP